jgi:hypothetical protein
MPQGRWPRRRPPGGWLGRLAQDPRAGWPGCASSSCPCWLRTTRSAISRAWRKWSETTPSRSTRRRNQDRAVLEHLAARPGVTTPSTNWRVVRPKRILGPAPGRRAPSRTPLPPISPRQSPRRSRFAHGLAGTARNRAGWVPVGNQPGDHVDGLVPHG